MSEVLAHASAGGLQRYTIWPLGSATHTHTHTHTQFIISHMHVNHLQQATTNEQRIVTSAGTCQLHQPTYIICHHYCQTMLLLSRLAADSTLWLRARLVVPIRCRNNGFTIAYSATKHQNLTTNSPIFETLALHKSFTYLRQCSCNCKHSLDNVKFHFFKWWNSLNGTTQHLLILRSFCSRVLCFLILCSAVNILTASTQSTDNCIECLLDFYAHRFYF